MVECDISLLRLTVESRWWRRVGNREERLLPAVSGEKGDAGPDRGVKKPCLVAFGVCSWDPLIIEKRVKKSKTTSLTKHLVRISKHPTVLVTPTPMLGCTNVFP
jgi:hypothetical protein